MTPAPAAKPRVVVVGPVPPQVGGVETFVRALLESRAFQDFDVVHVDTSKRRPKSTKGAFDLPNTLWAARHLATFAAVVATHRPQVVYMPIAGTLAGVLRDLELARIARLGGARVVGHQHASGIAKVLAARGVLGTWLHAGMRRYHRVLVLGTPWVSLFRAWDPEVPLGICPSAARLELLERGQALSRRVRAGGLRALFVGQIGEAKGVPEMIRAIALLARRGRDVTLTLVGADGRPGAVADARALARSLGVEDRVRFAGFAGGEVLYEHYMSHDVFLLPSFVEGVPVTILEAGAFSMPVIASPVGAVPALVHDGVNGLLVPPGEPERLAEAIDAVERDRSRALALGERLREDVRAYHPEHVSAIVANTLWQEWRAGDGDGDGAHAR